MANQRGEVQVFLGGKPHDLVFTMNTIADIEELLGRSFAKAFDEDIGIRDVRAAITAGIWNAERSAQGRRKARRLWTVERVGALMDMDDYGDQMAVVITGLLLFQGETKEQIEARLAGTDDDDDADDDADDQTKEKDSGEAKAETPRAGTGTNSSAAPDASASTAKPSGASPSGSLSTQRPATTDT